MLIPEIKVLPDREKLSREAAARIIYASGRAIGDHDKFNLALSGGSTPKALFELLATPEISTQLDWTSINIFFGDERCVPPDHAESNFRMAREALLSRVPLPGDNIYRMHGEADPQTAAADYGRMLKERFGDEGGLDLILLGMGPDGHTASLFPHTAALSETKHRCVANYVEVLNTWRITLTAGFINRSAEVMILAAGADKAARIDQVLQGPRAPQMLPIQLVAPQSGRLSWLVDAAAAGMTSTE